MPPLYTDSESEPDADDEAHDGDSLEEEDEVEYDYTSTDSGVNSPDASVLYNSTNPSYDGSVSRRVPPSPENPARRPRPDRDSSSSPSPRPARRMSSTPLRVGDTEGMSSADDAELSAILSQYEDSVKELRDTVRESRLIVRDTRLALGYVQRNSPQRRRRTPSSSPERELEGIRRGFRGRPDLLDFGSQWHRSRKPPPVQHMKPLPPARQPE